MDSLEWQLTNFIFSRNFDVALLFRKQLREKCADGCAAEHLLSSSAWCGKREGLPTFSANDMDPNASPGGFQFSSRTRENKTLLFEGVQKYVVSGWSFHEKGLA